MEDDEGNGDQSPALPPILRVWHSAHYLTFASFQEDGIGVRARKRVRER